MIYRTMNIWEGSESDMRTDATLCVYAPDNSPEIEINRRNPAVVILPGGGYEWLSDREAEPIALALAGDGICAFVLRYSVAPNRYPTQLLEVSRAVWLIRENAEAWHVDENNISVMGFSAGGHLAASLGVFWKEPFICEKLSMREGQNRPNKLILSYAVITSDTSYAHRGSFYSLVGEDKSEEQYEAVSVERFVSADTPPAFIWHTFSDAAVPVENALTFAHALSEAGVPFELHIYPQGPHGLSLCDCRTSANAITLSPYAAGWFDACKNWIKDFKTGS